MEIKTVYDNGGECLGNEYIDLSGLQKDSKQAILQLIYLDETVNIFNKYNKKDNDLKGEP